MVENQKLEKLDSVLSKLGYPCINLTLQESQGNQVNRAIKKATFKNSGLSLASDLAIKNLDDVLTLLKWNSKNGYRFYRMSSNMFPWHSEYELQELPAYSDIVLRLQNIGSFAKEHDMRLTFHPGPFNILGSHNPYVVKTTIKDLDDHAEIMDIMGLEASPWAKINIHIGTTNGGKELVYERFRKGFGKLSASTKSRLTVENDDKPSMYSVVDLKKNISDVIGVPVVFDVHHHMFRNEGISHEDAAKIAASTWPIGIDPVFHYSSTILYERQGLARAHADWIYDEIKDYGTNAWYMCECKQKELAVKKYREAGSKKSLILESFNMISDV